VLDADYFPHATQQQRALMGNNSSINKQPADWASKSTESGRLRQIRTMAPSCSAQAVTRQEALQGRWCSTRAAAWQEALHGRRRCRRRCKGGDAVGGAGGARQNSVFAYIEIGKRRIVILSHNIMCI